jgi:hypothetical protein
MIRSMVSGLVAVRIGMVVVGLLVAHMVGAQDGEGRMAGKLTDGMEHTDIVAVMADTMVHTSAVGFTVAEDDKWRNNEPRTMPEM